MPNDPTPLTERLRQQADRAARIWGSPDGDDPTVVDHLWFSAHEVADALDAKDATIERLTAALELIAGLRGPVVLRQPRLDRELRQIAREALSDE
ncbi:MAG: hypothetical protein ACPGVG_19905 [Mycobacterium sp.]